MIQAMREGLAGDGDVEAVGDGEIGQGLSTGVVALGEEHLFVLTMKGAPLGDATFHGATDAVGNGIRPEFVLQFLEDSDGHDARDLDHLQHPRPHIGQRIPAGSPGARLLLL